MPVSAAAVGSVSAFLPHFFSTESAAFTNSQPSLSFSRSSTVRRTPLLSAPKVSVSTSIDTKTEGVLDKSPTEIRQARRSADWQAAREYYEKGLIYKVKIDSYNTGGLLIRFYSLIGFLPFPQLSPSHYCKEPHKTVQEIGKGLIGSIVSVKVIKVDESKRKLVVSEKQAVWSMLSEQLSIGDIFEAKVGTVEDYGAFVHLRFSDGNCYLTGLLHVSEVSWDLVQDARDVLTEGDEVRVKIVNIDREKTRIQLSIRQLEEDPLLETLDKVISQDPSIDPDNFANDHFSIEPLPGLDTIMEELLQEDGIIDVKITRQGFEKRVVSQDLQLWLSNALPTEDQYTLLARAGRQVQEIQLKTSLDQEGIKKALQHVLERVP